MEVQIIDFPKIYDPRGNLTFIQNNEKVPFEIKRVFWTYDVPGGENRGGHAYYKQYEIIIALSGSFDVVLKDSDGNSHKFPLNRSYYGLYIPPLTWRHMENFSTNAVGLHLSSMEYAETDYIREFDNYKEVLRNVK
jgi:hypothetical protein